jgi:2-dehydropantoate 2-reductase
VRYVVIGAGAVGATVATELHQAGVPVLLVARGAQLDALRRNGLVYLRPQGKRRITLPVIGGPDEVQLRSGDVLVLATKSQDTEAALQEWAWSPALSGHRMATAAEVVPVLSLQNGLENERLALRRFACVFGARVNVPARYLTAGEVISAGANKVGALWIGRFPSGGHAVLEQIAHDLTQAGFLVMVVPDIIRWKANKLLLNLENALDALYPPSPLVDEVARALHDEGRAVLAQAGIAIADMARENELDLAEVAIEAVPGMEEHGSATWRGSTWQSLARDGSLETDFLNGEIVLLARMAGGEAPLNAAVQRRVREAVSRGIGAGGLDDADLVALALEYGLDVSASSSH